MSKGLEDLVDLMFDTDMEEVMKEKSTLEYINKLQQENKHLNLQLDQALKDYEELLIKIGKAIDWCDEIIRTFCEDDKQVVVAYEIKEILGDKE